MSAAVHHIAHHVPRSPQLENGYLRLSNELNQALCRAHLSANELAVVLAIVAKTYGFNKKTDDVSASQLGEYCDIARNHVTEVLRSLESKNIITKRPGRYGCIIGIQKDYSQWALKGKRQAKKEASPKLGLVAEVVRNSDEASPKLGQEIVRTSDTQKTTSKDNQQKTKNICATQALRDSFERFYSVYPKKRNRKDAEKAFAKLNPDADQLQAILDGLARCKLSDQWNDPQFIPYPASWLNAGGWMDEVQVAYSTDELAVIAAYNSALADVSGQIDAAIFSESRAGAIRQFRTLSDKPEFWNADLMIAFMFCLRSYFLLNWPPLTLENPSRLMSQSKPAFGGRLAFSATQGK
jgi:phage replication O-like protein O